MSDNELIALYIGFGTVIGSLIGAFISTFLSRAHKISSFRQEWINSIREVFSDMLLQMEVYSDAAHQDKEKIHKIKIELIRAISKAKLFLNLGEESSSKLIELLEVIPSKYIGNEEGANEIRAIQHVVESSMRDILKEEWNRVRDGELIWRIKKIFKPGGFFEEFYCSRLVVIILLISSIVIFVKLVNCT